MRNLGIGEDFGEVVDRCARNVVFLELLEPNVARLAAEDGLKQPWQHAIVLLAVALGLEVGILLPLRVAGNLGEAAPEFRRRREMDHESLPVRIEEGINLGRARARFARRGLAGLEK